MTLKGAVKMKNINLQKQSPLSFSHVIYNQNHVDILNYNRNLQSKLTFFSEMIKETYQNLLLFFVENKEVPDVVLTIKEDFLRDYKNVEKQGTPVLDNLSEEIKNKKINKETYDMLIKIIEHQEKITNDILERDISLERIHVILNHLRDLPFYLKSDLEINTLPVFNPEHVSIKYNTTINKKMELIHTYYNPFEKEIA